MALHLFSPPFEKSKFLLISMVFPDFENMASLENHELSSGYINILMYIGTNVYICYSSLFEVIVV